MGIWRPSEPFKIELQGQEKICVELRCPYVGCRGSFIVHKKRWETSFPNQTILTRPCPYCFRSSYFPDAEERANVKGLKVVIPK